MSEAIRPTPLQAMLAWRARCIDAATILVVTWLVALGTGGSAAGMVFRVTGAVALLLTIGLWGHLFRCALEAGGRDYALGHTALAIVLTPVFFLGVLVVPRLIESDIAKGVVSYERPAPVPFGERMRRWLPDMLGLVVAAVLLASVDDRVGGLLGLLVAVLIVGDKFVSAWRSR